MPDVTPATPGQAAALPKFLGHPDDLCEQWIAETWEPDPDAAWDREDMQSAYREGRDEARRQLAPAWDALAAERDYYRGWAERNGHALNNVTRERDQLQAAHNALAAKNAELAAALADVTQAADNYRNGMAAIAVQRDTARAELVAMTVGRDRLQGELTQARAKLAELEQLATRWAETEPAARLTRDELVEQYQRQECARSLRAELEG